MTQFDYFVVLGGMRTGSNFLEENLNAFPDLACVGEVFNPTFIGKPGRDTYLGVSLEERDDDPEILIEKIRNQEEKLNGFRLFDDHDFRALYSCLNDPKCAKIVLLRNPLDSYISLKIARKTGQWRLMNENDSVKKTIEFNAEEFSEYLENKQAFQVQILNTLQKTGQTAFYIAYEDLQDTGVLNGVARFLGSNAQVDQLNQRLKRQNPETPEQKVENFEQMRESLAQIDWFNAQRTPHFEPRCVPRVTSYVTARHVPLLYMPLKSGPNDAISSWMAQLGGGDSEALGGGFDRQGLIQWLDEHANHRSFTVVRHPLAWAHAAFCQRILGIGAERFEWISSLLAEQYGFLMPSILPEKSADIEHFEGYDLSLHERGFRAFLNFLCRNLKGQTSVRIDPAWGNQFGLIQAMSDVLIPDMVVYEDRLMQDLSYLAQATGACGAPDFKYISDPFSLWLKAIYQDDLEKMSQEIYTQDYQKFGFQPYHIHES